MQLVYGFKNFLYFRVFEVEIYCSVYNEKTQWSAIDLTKNHCIPLRNITHLPTSTRGSY